MRASCEPVPSSEVGTKENPSVGADGLSKISHETGRSITGAEFFASFGVIVQVRDLVEAINFAWEEFDSGRELKTYGLWEREYIRGLIAQGLAIYRECYRGEILRGFELLFGCTYETFEVSLLELQDAFLSEGGAE